MYVLRTYVHACLCIYLRTSIFCTICIYTCTRTCTHKQTEQLVEVESVLTSFVNAALAYLRGRKAVVEGEGGGDTQKKGPRCGRVKYLLAVPMLGFDSSKTNGQDLGVKVI